MTYKTQTSLPMRLTKKVLLITVLTVLSLVITPVFITKPADAVADSCALFGATSGNGVSTFSLQVPVSGTYTIWTRMRVVGSANHGILLRVDNSGCYDVGGSNTAPTNSWQWVDYSDGSDSNVVNVPLVAGKHTFQFVHTDSTIEVDRVTLVSGTGLVATIGQLLGLTPGLS
ncbi:MAG TPA: hypothetical protein VMB52_04950 [Verrucomicrobiae bacterium]|nr:hypothetical protein [Verrucomicrobiae bacterium]